MNTVSMDIAAGRGAVGGGLLVAGLIVVAVLIGAFVFGVRVMRRESRRPRREEQPHLPADGPVREVRENRAPDEMPRSDERILPHDLPAHGNSGSRTDPSADRPRWNDGSSGSFGSGGPGGR
ncbi:DUF6479 family protein [Streptomyces sp. DH24]|uniref:DUF6479 family protein n=1 Tax=Streptomyces sp. DH24 TaxID=3040123 RepID=UPI0024421CCF|nr:DUF6479 family protein [Streptomyces sp. DH24]MDG9718020.1 DUF6479 family protein [Streptomyces sp. DH24]